MLSRRQFLAAAAAGAASLGWEDNAAAAVSWRTDFPAQADGLGWPGFACVGVANLRREGGQGLLEAGSDVFPNDPRPVAFALDRRFVDGSVTAVVAASGAGAGVVRRASHGHYYAAIYDQEQAALTIVRRAGDEVVERARVLAPLVRLPAALTLASAGTSPTRLTATLVDADARRYTASAADTHGSLQGPGDPGVLSTARTLFPSERNETLPALGNVHLLPYGVQEGQVVLESPAGQAVIGTIRERSTAAFREISVTTNEAFRVTPPSVVAATSGVPSERGATVHVATDVPARVSIEVAARPDFRDARRVEIGATSDFEAATHRLSGLDADSRVYWRALATRRGRTAAGPPRAFRVLPLEGSSSPASIAVGACASQFGEIFDRLADRRPDVFVWQGDLNYPDTQGPLAQTVSGYAGVWRDFLANPRMRPILDSGCFVAGRDDHDYGVQDAHSENLKPFGLAPWEALMERGAYHRFTAGLAEVWVIDQRRFKSPPGQPDTQAKTLLGARQRGWLLDTLSTSDAPFKVICSPCTLSPTQSENSRDGNWSAGYTAERDLLLRHIEQQVTGTTIFITGDTHYTMVYDRDGLFEARPCPLDIPTPNDITLVDPLAAQELRGRPGIVYAEDRLGHFAHLRVAGEGSIARLDLTLTRQDGVAGYTRRFEEPITGPTRRVSAGPRRGLRRRGGNEGLGTRRLPAGARGGSGSGGSSGLPFTGSRPLGLALAGALLAATGAMARRMGAARKG